MAFRLKAKAEIYYFYLVFSFRLPCFFGVASEIMRLGRRCVSRKVETKDTLTVVLGILQM